MAKNFGTEPKQWLRTEESKRYLDKLAIVQKCRTADLLKVRRGGIPGNQGTWATDHLIASRFAQWLDVDFAIQVDIMVTNILVGNAVYAESFRGVWPLIIDGSVYYNYIEVLRALGYSTQSGWVSKRKKQNPDNFTKMFHRNFITIEYAQQLEREYYCPSQLSLNFEMEGGVA
jgi:hypothetical protein